MRKPLSGGLWGIVLGLAIAIVLQQQGAWPADEITVALIPGSLGILGVIITSVGRSGSTAALTIAILIVVPLTAYGATGLGGIGETGQLNGGCTVEATSAVDSIDSPADTSRGDPFVIDPQASLSWKATSGGNVFDDYPWEIWVDVAGIAVVVDEEESENNDAGDTENTGDVANVEEFGESRGLPVSQLRGVFMVGGFASVCNGFGFVTIQAGLLETIAAKIAAALAVLAFIMLIRAALSGRGGETNTSIPSSPAYEPGTLAAPNPVAPEGSSSDESPPESDDSIATDIAAGAFQGGYTVDNLKDADLSDDDRKELVREYLEGDPDQEPPVPEQHTPTESSEKSPEAEDGQAEDEDRYKGLPGLED